MYQIINKNTGKLIKSRSKSFFSSIGHIKLMIGSVFKGKIKYTPIEDIEVIEYELIEKSRKPLKEYL
ncbi:MAG: hypothetical protein KDH96_11830 [Candidatus Riesia sp.]|nr:hypothetical protein [Candidatus Riesia sp.]